MSPSLIPIHILRFLVYFSFHFFVHFISVTPSFYLSKKLDNVRLVRDVSKIYEEILWQLESIDDWITRFQLKSAKHSKRTLCQFLQSEPSKRTAQHWVLMILDLKMRKHPYRIVSQFDCVTLCLQIHNQTPKSSSSCFVTESNKVPFIKISLSLSV